MSPGRIAAAGIAALSLAACGLIERGLGPAPVSTAAPAWPASAPSELLAYLARLRGMNERALATEATRQKQAARGEGDLGHVKAAMALAMGLADEGEVIALAEPVAKKESAGEELRSMASFLLVQAAERRRLRESAAGSGTRLRDERKAAETQKQRADALQERVTQLQERAAQLQQKLDALTEIERSLADRQPQVR